MAFTELLEQPEAVRFLQRSLERGRLAHGYLFAGARLGELEAAARTLAKTLNCAQPPRRAPNGLPLDSCDRCESCRRIDADSHPDIAWLRPESKLRIISIEQVRDLSQTVNLKSASARYKVAILDGADRLTLAAANAFLKTLEEPPADSILILLSTEPQRMLETIRSRCLRLNFAGEAGRERDAAMVAWLKSFSEAAAGAPRSLLSRYRLLSVILTKLNELKAVITETVTKRSPLERFEDIDPDLREKWEAELTAAIEAEYRRQRADWLTGLQWWLRDVWLETMRLGGELFTYPQLAGAAQTVAGRMTPEQAMENLRVLDETQRLLSGNIQEALTLEVGLLRLTL